MKSAIVGFVTALTLSFSPAIAAKKVAIDQDEVQIHESADAGSAVLEVLHKGDSISVSNNPVNGFHKARGPSGAIGWIDASQLNLDGDSKSPESAVAEAVSPPARSTARKQAKGAHKTWSIRGLGGLTLSTPTVAATPFSTSPVTYLINFGASASYQLLEWLGVELRVEYLVRSRTFVPGNATSSTYTIFASSMPIMVGPVVRIVDTPRFEVRLGAVGGIAAMTKYEMNEMILLDGSGSGSLTEYSGLAYAFLGKVDATFKIAPSFGVFGEAGYRILTTPSALPVMSGSDLYTSDGNSISLPVNYSGLFFGGGVAFFF